MPIQNEESGTSCRRNDHFLPSKNGTCDGNILPPLEASRPLPTIFVGSSMGFVFLGKSHWLPFFSSFLVCASVATYYQRDIKLTFALVHNMCKRSNIFYERNIKLVFAHIDNMCKSSNIFYMNETSNLCSCT